MKLNHDKKAALALGALVLAFLLNWWLGPDPADATHPRKAAGVCFPVQLWDAHPADRA